MEKELPDKLERLNRLNINVVRELSLVGLQVQVTTNTLCGREQWHFVPRIP